MKDRPRGGFGGLRKLKQRHSWDEDDDFKQALYTQSKEARLTTSTALTPQLTQTKVQMPATIQHQTMKKAPASEERSLTDLNSNENIVKRKGKSASKRKVTNTEHSKRGKLFQMRKYSRRVGVAMKSSHEDRKKRDNANKANAVKTRMGRCRK